MNTYEFMFFFRWPEWPKIFEIAGKVFKPRCNCVIALYLLLNGDQMPKTNKTLIYLIGIFG